MIPSARALGALAACFGLLSALPARADRHDQSTGSAPQFSLSQGLTFNNNITLLASDVNFGPAALARDDIIGTLRLDAAERVGHARFNYAFTRAHFFKNDDLHYFDHYFRGSYEAPGKGASFYRVSLDYNKFDPDHHVQPDPQTGFPFTTTEIPNRRVYNAVINQELAPKDQLQIQAVDQSLRFENNPVLDNTAHGGLVRYTRLFSKATNAFVEAGTNTKRYQNISGDFGAPASLRTPQDSQGVGVSHVPSERFGSVLKFNRINQSANIADFVLDQWDLSWITAYTPGGGPTLVLTTQRSRRAFPLRPVADGSPQDDHELLANLSSSWRLDRGVRAIVSLTYDRNHSNNTEFDYVNRIAAVEVRESF